MLLLAVRGDVPREYVGIPIFTTSALHHGSGQRYLESVRCYKPRKIERRTLPRKAILRQSPCLPLGNSRQLEPSARGRPPADLRLSRLHALLGPQSHRESEAEAQDVEKRLRRALVEINAWLRQERNTRQLPDLWQAVAGKIRGHLTYFGVTDNEPRPEVIPDGGATLTL